MKRTSTAGTGSTQARILTAAMALFARSGYNGVSTRDIASAVGVNEVTIYRHYPHKRDLYFAVLESELRQVHLRGDLLARLADASDGRAALNRTFELIAAALTQKPDLIRLVQFSALELGEDIDPLLRKHLRELIEVIASYLKPWISTGELCRSDARAPILMFVAIVFGYGSLHRIFSGSPSGPESIFEVYTQLLLLLQPLDSV